MIGFRFLVSLLAVLNTAQAIHYLGRVNPATKELTWSATGVSFTFRGTSATIGLKAVSGTNSAEIVVDGKRTFLPNVSGSVVSTPTNLTHGYHTVVFRKLSEPSFGSIFLGKITTDGKFGSDVPSRPRKIEIIGDSITVGYGIGALLPCTNTASLEDITKTYSALAANEFGADYSIVAWSGRGITRNYVQAAPDTSPIISDLYSRYGANDPGGSYTFPRGRNPDAVVINIGTNDFSYLGSAINGSTVALRPPLNPRTYTTAVVNFVRSIKSKYPNASFFLVTSPMLNDGYPSLEDAQKTTQTDALKDAIAQLNGTSVYLVDWPSQEGDVGCDYHPTPKTNAVGAEKLIASIRQALGW